MIRTMMTAAALALSLPLAQAETMSAEEAARLLCPEVGTPAPEFSAVTRDDIPVTLADISGQGGAVIVFSRSLDWCPYCKKQAIELQEIADTLEAEGWPLSLITYDSPEVIDAFGTEAGLTYTLLSDQGSAMIDAFGLRNEDVNAGSRFDGIPHPAIVYIGADGKIVGIQREEGYKDRPPTEGIPQLVALLNQDLPLEAQ